MPAALNFLNNSVNDLDSSHIFTPSYPGCSLFYGFLNVQHIHILQLIDL